MISSIPESPKARVFTYEELCSYREQSSASYFEFVRIPSMSVGFYSIAVGDDDLQTPHHEDELYYVIRGRALLMIDGTDFEVGPQSSAFVPKMATHKFHTITEALELLVFFAPKFTDNGEPVPFYQEGE